MVKSIWLWQNIVSPHMSGLAEALAEIGIDVTYIANKEMRPERAALGWSVPIFNKCKCKIAKDKHDIDILIQSAPKESIHLCQGFRGNDMISYVQNELSEKNLDMWILMETVDDNGWKKILKRLVYRYLFKQKVDSVKGVLAIGYTTREWIVERGFPDQHVYPFTYFLPELNHEKTPSVGTEKPFRFLFVGKMVALKRLKFLVESLSKIKEYDFVLRVVGSGHNENSYRQYAEKHLGDKLVWIGKKKQHEVTIEMQKSDCLVLPSRYDGWGAVVSESLMVGTPVIVSDRCGSAGLVYDTNYGEVFRTDDQMDLIIKLKSMLKDGKAPLKKRQEIMKWAHCLTATEGAVYLKKILEHQSQDKNRPLPPWEACK